MNGGFSTTLNTSGHSPTIPEYFRGCRKTKEDSKKLEKIFEVVRKLPKIFKETLQKISTLFFSLISHMKDIFFTAYRKDFFFQEKPAFKHFNTVFSPETVNIKKLARLIPDT